MGENKTVALVVRGAEHEWVFAVQGSEKNMADWREDGLEVHELEHIVPTAVAETGYVPTLVYASVEKFVREHSFWVVGALVCAIGGFLYGFLQ